MAGQLMGQSEFKDLKPFEGIKFYPGTSNFGEVGEER